MVFLFGGLAALLFAKTLRLPQRSALFLYLWHTTFSMVYLWYSLNTVADATIYYDQSLSHTGGMMPGTGFVYFFTAIFTKYLGLSYLGGFLVYNSIGALGLLAFAAVVRSAVEGKPRVIRFVGWGALLLPSVSFWSGAIGKDAISFFSACLFLWSGLQVRGRAGWMGLAVVAMLLVRPHMAAVMVAAIVGGIVFSRGIKLTLRVFLATVGIVSAIAIVPFALEYSGLGEAEGAADIADYVERRQGYNQDGGGGIDISTMSPPMQLLTYLYRPLPFEAHSATALAASIENVALIVLTLAMLRAVVSRRRVKDAHTNWMLWMYAGGSWLILAVTTANLGIAARQKWMFVPILLYLALSLLGRTKPSMRSARTAFRGR
ncbi:hypothetical protein [Thermomonas fusca]|uniref:Glycosyltransferase RgtA/B/C/D-like domain-containing protein n=1 Tax=Thermomonas fusca TaxID=215690 RepID=A0A5R9PFH4_9GAMM|nr:hypothetical protein [Thermomonas fusca]TLX21360.1 hypothetical protein E5S66_10500 [Thermomonas fusca]